MTNMRIISYLKRARTRPVDWLRVGLILAVAIGITLRVIQFRHIPTGLYHDEAFNGLDGQNTIKGNIRLFYPANNGREPLFIWLIALSIKIWGASPFSVRFPALVLGILTLPACYVMTRELFGQRIGVLATGVLAITLWAIHFSRIGFRATLLPPLTSFGVWQVARGIRTGRWWHWVLGGATAGVLIYTYISSRTAILPVAFFVLYTWWRRRSLSIPAVRDWLLFTITAAVLMTPFVLYTLFHWEQVFMRINDVYSVFDSQEPGKMLLYNLVDRSKMFTFKGDPHYRHNFPLRPVFDPGLGAMFYVGLWLAIRQFKHSYAAAFLLIWTTCMLLPTLLTDEYVNFIRSMGELPFIAIYPAIGLDWTWEKISRTKSKKWATVAVLAVLSFGLGSTIWHYFVRYPSLPEACYRFECAGVQMSAEINTYLGRGWTADKWFVRDEPGYADRRVFLLMDLREDLLNARYLIPESPNLNVLDMQNLEAVPFHQYPSMVFYGRYISEHPDFWSPDLLNRLPPNSLIEISEGPLVNMPPGWSPDIAYLRLSVSPRRSPSTFLAELDQGISLVDNCVQERDGKVLVRLVWQISEPVPIDYTVFAHYERDGEMIAQNDSSPGAKYHPMVKWRPGDQFMDEREIAVPDVLTGDQIWVGMYLWQTGERLPVLKASVPVQDDRILLSMRPCERD